MIKSTSARKRVGVCGPRNSQKAVLLPVQLTPVCVPSALEGFPSHHILSQVHCAGALVCVCSVQVAPPLVCWHATLESTAVCVCVCLLAAKCPHLPAKHTHGCGQQ